MLIEKKNVAELLPADYNPRKDLKPGDPEYEKLKRSIEQFGYVEPVIWNATTGRVVGGHQRLKVLQDMGMTEVDCVVVELDEEHEKALNVALNKISGEWDNDKLALLIADLQGADFDVSLTGFEPEELEDLFREDTKKDVQDDDFDVDAELAKPTFSKAGDLWLLGEHRLVCGDSTKPETYELLMNFCDALGLGLFTAVGVHKGYMQGHESGFFLVFLGIITGIGGGMLRDMLAGEMPFVLYKRVYAIAAIVGGIVCECLLATDVYLAMAAGTLATLLIRLLATYYCWDLPKALRSRR